MHRTCHVAALVHSLRSRRGSGFEIPIPQFIDALIEEHQQWRQRRVVRGTDQSEKMNEMMNKVNNDRDDTSQQQLPTAEFDSVSTKTAFLSYTPLRIFNTFFANLLNNWRAIRLYIDLIQEPMWGVYDGTRFICAVDLCRTYAALGLEKNVLGAEKAVGLYLAGVVFGGPDMYLVRILFISN